MRSSFPFTPSPNSFGEVTGLVQDLATVAGRRRDAQRVRVSSEDADLEVIRVLDAPPSVVWQYYRFAARRKSLAGLAARCPCCIAPTTRSNGREDRQRHFERASAPSTITSTPDISLRRTKGREGPTRDILPWAPVDLKSKFKLTLPRSVFAHTDRRSVVRFGASLSATLSPDLRRPVSR